MSFQHDIDVRMEPDESAIALELLAAVEQAAIECAKLMGCGDRHAADNAAVEAMRRAMDGCDIDGTIVIGEGERDEAPMLYIGERVGNPDSMHKVDIAVDPLEGTNLCATGSNNAIAVMAVSEQGGLLHAPDIYMNKLVVPTPAVGKVDLDAPIAETCHIVADCLQREVHDLVVVVLDRPRHEAIIEQLRETGARIKLIGDGDLSAGITVAVRGTGVHMAVGTGGAPEGVLTAAALKCLGGEIIARLAPKDQAQRERCLKMGIDPDRKLRTDELAPGRHIVFLASGVTRGDLLYGVRFFGTGVRVNTLLLTHESKVVRFLDSIHLEERGSIQITRE
jgi:fructose-1,6-bisphosphatase II